MGGLAYSVGLPIPGTNGMFDSPSDVRRWLAEIAEAEAERV